MPGKLSFVALALLLVFSISVFSATQSKSVSESVTIIDVNSVSQQPKTVRPGDSFTHSIVLNNTAFEISATELSVEIVPPAEFEVQGENILHAEELRKKENRTFVFRLKAKEGIPAGQYNISYKITYLNRGEPRDETRNVAVTVSDYYKLDIINVKATPTTPHIDDRVVISAEILNAGSNTSRNTKAGLTLTSIGSFGTFVTESDTVIELNSILPGQKKPVQFEIIPTRKTSPGIYSFVIDANCLDCSEKAKETLNLQVFGNAELFVSGMDYSVEGKDIKKILQGDLFSISIQLDNIGEEKAQAVTVFAEADEGIKGAGKSFIGTIDPDDSGAAVFDYSVDPKAEAKEYKINFQIEYLDELGRKQQLTDSYSLFVEKAPEPGIEGTLVLSVAILVLLYFILRLVFRQLKMRKLQ